MKEKHIDFSDYNSLLFFKIWRNQYLKNLIFKDMMMYNLFSYSVDFDSSQQLIKDNEQYVKSLVLRIPKTLKQEENEINKLDKIVNSLPKGTESIKIYQTNDIMYDFSIFSNVTTLNFTKFDKPINISTLPTTLKKISFGSHFNQPLNKKLLPGNLETIILGCCFDQPLNDLPQSIIEIKFLSNSCFGNEINSNKLPQSLKKLSLPRNFNMNKINGILPNQLEKLKITNLDETFFNLTKHFKLKVYNKNGNLSSNEQLSNLLKLKTNIIPPSVTNLTIFYHTFDNPFLQPPPQQQLSSQFCNVNLNTTTSNLFSYWILYKMTSKQFLDRFESIKSLKVNCIENNFKLDNHSKSCLTNLIILNLKDFNYHSYTKPIKDFKVFTNLKCLRIGNYNSTITFNTLPQSLELLELGDRFKQPIHKKWLPNSIKYIIVLYKNTQISINSLPNSLEKIWITDDHYQLIDFKFFIPLIGKLKISNQLFIWKVTNKIIKKKYDNYLY
ncbi:hypothetical protein ACTA71_011562 [Dictyostelium dimigraforme]